MDTKTGLDHNLEVKCSVDDIVDLMLNGYNESGAIVCSTDEVQKYNSYFDQELIFEPTLENKDMHTRSNTWFMPDSYMNIDVLSLCISRCTRQEEIDRVNAEFEEFNNKNLINLLRYFVFLVDIMRKESIIWGVGRGSSVSSYILYLIGIHKVDSIKYNLDFKEFIKE